ncbi:hypothetical protein [Candidatus Nitrososphaera evergladensis]|nr:hypothetical protein [Candidatus Nitrososphaera evergladensis]
MAFEIHASYLAFGISLPLVVWFVATHRKELAGKETIVTRRHYTATDTAAA